MPDNIIADPAIIEQWVAEKLDIQKIREKLLTLGWNEEATNIYIKEFQKRKFAKRREYGFICLASGAVFGFISCLLSVLNPIPELFNWTLYGLTSVAVVLIVAGLYFVLE